ncbi:MAG: TonB-dependent receptor [Bacteroidales bacterium]|nr:TonB-dependent receptor [Bacteroidales bacterium]
MKKLLIFLLFLFVISKPTYSQTKKDYVVYGYIYDSETGECLISANIYNPQTLKGTISNEFGYYSFKVPQGNESLKVSYIGYETMSLDLNLNKDTMLIVKLVPTIQLQEVVVTDTRPEVGVNSTRIGASTVPLDIVKNKPVLLGEPDILKTIQALPGVQSGMSGTCGIHVRGGDPDQNLFLLDGMPLYNVNHLFGFVSVFQAEAVKNVDFYKSSFPARFGGRLSSIVDVRTKDGDMKNYYGSFSIGLLTSHINFEGPIIKEKTSFIISARRSYLDWLIKPFLGKGTKAGLSIYDINTKINHRFNDKCRLFFSLYNGQDKLKFLYSENFASNGYKDDVNQIWGNTLITMRLNTIITPRLFNNTTIAYTGYISKIENSSYEWNKYGSGFGFDSNPEKQETTIESSYHSKIKDYSILTDFDFQIASIHVLKFGGAIYFHEFCPDVQTTKFKEKEGKNSIDSTIQLSPNKITAREYNVYIEDDFPIYSKLQANIGFHFSLFNVENKNYFSAQPRISLSWIFIKNWRLKTGFCLMQQNIHMLSSSDLNLPTDLWVPVTKLIKPMTSTQYSLGGYYTGIKDWEFTLESYYKHSYNLLEYKDGMSAMGSSINWQEKVEMGKGDSYGLELMAQRTKGRLNGWVNYTISKTTRQFPNGTINNGYSFPYKYDRRHVINITANYQLTPKIEINAEWNFMSGAHSSVAVGNDIVYYNDINQDYGTDWMSPVTGTEFARFEIIPRYEGRNNYKLPSCHSLNLGISFHKQKKHGERIWNFSLINAYNHKNPDWIYLESEVDNKLEVHNRIQKLTLISFIPAFSYTFNFK